MRFTLRVPHELKALVDQYVGGRKRTDELYSVNEMFLEGARRMVFAAVMQGPCEARLRAEVKYQNSVITPEQLAETMADWQPENKAPEATLDKGLPMSLMTEFDYSGSTPLPKVTLEEAVMEIEGPLSRIREDAFRRSDAVKPYIPSPAVAHSNGEATEAEIEALIRKHTTTTLGTAPAGETTVVQVGQVPKPGEPVLVGPVFPDHPFDMYLAGMRAENERAANKFDREILETYDSLDASARAVGMEPIKDSEGRPALDNSKVTPWLPIMQRMKGAPVHMSLQDSDEYRTLCGGKYPTHAEGWRHWWTVEQKAAWLDEHRPLRIEESK